MTHKRADLQAIRGIAIIAVLLFHFFPGWFPNGYVGVDQFFVLSGYLIAMLLCGKELDRLSIETFYYRRVKRIVPLYALFVFLVLLSLFIFFPQANIDLNMQSAQYALSFTTNIQGISPNKQYAVMLQLAVDLFTHTWSLAVEMQFYLLVPLIFYATAKFGNNLILVIGCGSIIYYTTTDDATAFNSVFARLWQFCIGIGAFILVPLIHNGSDTELFLGDNSSYKGILAQLFERCSLFFDKKVLESSLKSKSKRHLVEIVSYICLGCTLVEEMCQTEIPAMLLRVSVSIFTGILIVLGSRDSILPVNNRVLIYAGDISYALYLVHWPLYSYVKFQYPDDFEVLGIALLLSIFLAVFITETYEKGYLRMEKYSVLLLIGILYVLCLVVVISHGINADTDIIEDFDVDFDFSGNITKEDAYKLNIKWNANDGPQLRPPACISRDDVCEFKRPVNFSSDGPSILLLGNSYAGNAADLFNDSCNQTAKRIVVFWAEGCEMLIHTSSWKPCSSKTTDGYLDIVKREKPDILFMLVRHVELMKPFALNVSILDDSLYKEALVRLKNYEELVSKTIYVLDAMPRPDSNQLIRWIYGDPKMGIMPNMTSFLGISSERSEFARYRLRQLVNNCKKCQLIDYSPYLTVKGEFQVYDTSNGLSHFTANLHLTPLALRKIKPLIQSICRSL